MRSSNLSVFLNKKLVSADTIVPLILELKAYCPEIKICFWIPDRDTYRSIFINKVLFEVISTAGQVKILGTSKYSGFIMLLKRCELIANLSFLFLKLMFGREKIIHFGYLTAFPYRVLFYARRKSIFLMEADTWGYTRLMSRIVRNSDSIPFPKVMPPAGRVISTSRDWFMLGHANYSNLPRYHYGCPKLKKVWGDHLRKISDSYLNSYFNERGLNTPSDFLSVMLGSLGYLPYLRDEMVPVELLEEALDELLKAHPDYIILLKPHHITDLVKLGRIIDNIGSKRIMICNLHPMVLACKAKLALCIAYSSTLADFHISGIPTVEYTHYNETALSVSGGGSMRPEYVTHFINHDRLRLRETIKDILRGRIDRNLTQCSDSANDLLTALTS